ncbi:MAG: hypothetical protein QG597_2950 [Actinomycetota bacterium]|nr:hypothetical protein [Actinomycetota bacterium]
MTTHITTKEYRRRLAAAEAAAKAQGVDALLFTPGADLMYLCGYEAVPLERLTCLMITPEGPAAIIVPELEVLAAEASPVAALGIQIVPWSETASPYRTLAKRLKKANKVAVAPQMWASHVFALQEQLRVARFRSDDIVADLRMRKSKVEIAALVEAGEAIDRVHAQVPALLRPGRTEREVGADIAALILSEGHATVDFVIVASGPNGASPHHEVSERVIEEGDPVVVDIGGTMPSGYCSDCTRTYAVGHPPAEFREAYAVLKAAQRAAVDHVRPGVTCESVDAAARDVMAAAGLGSAFMHRTGHGIGMSTHEEPYIVAGNTTVVEPGFAFSIEPGFYLPGKFGARIEDIVVATDSGAVSCNNQSHDLVVVDL